MSSIKTHLTVNLARRCLPLLQDAHRSYILAHEGFKDVLIVAGDAVPADAPAAYDPYNLMFPYRSDPRNDGIDPGIDPSIFDDLFPNGSVDADGTLAEGIF